MTTQKIFCIYHKDCLDGTTAAAVVLKKFKETEMHPLKHDYTQKDMATLKEKLDDETTLFIVDFSLREGHTDELLQTGAKIINLDHHIGVNERLEKIKHENFEYVFDNNRSGASLSWIYFFEENSMPQIIKLAENVDLFRNMKEKNTRSFASYGVFLINKPEKIIGLFSTNINTILEKGNSISEFNDIIVGEFIKDAEETKLQIGEHIVYAYNPPRNLRSEIGHHLSQKNNQAVALFHIDGETVKFSFRGEDSHTPSALDLAQLLGGNGHRNAAGARMSLSEFTKMIQK